MTRWTIELDRAIESASRYLVQQAHAGFSEARHDMTFPRSAGFTGPERQSSDLFSRAVLGGLLLDIADLDRRHESRGLELRALARREADYVASRKLPTRRGGWSYFPDLPELPPDLDSLSAALSLFARAAPELVELCAEPIETALAGAASDGAIETWIVSPNDTELERSQMNWGITRCWGTGTDPDVLANFCQALLAADPCRHAAWIERGITKLVEMQQDDGSWAGTWYAGAGYGTALVVQLLQSLKTGRNPVTRARACLGLTQREDGGWGNPAPLPLETAVSIWALQLGQDALDSRVVAGCDSLLRIQNPDGSWFSSPWIQMPIGRATGTVLRLATFESITITTAFCLRSLVGMRERESGGQGSP